VHAVRCQDIRPLVHFAVRAFFGIHGTRFRLLSGCRGYPPIFSLICTLREWLQKKVSTSHTRSVVYPSIIAILARPFPGSAGPPGLTCAVEANWPKNRRLHQNANTSYMAFIFVTIQHYWQFFLVHRHCKGTRTNITL